MEAGWWRVFRKSRRKLLCTGRVGGKRVQQKEVIQKLMVTDEGGE